MDLHDILYLDVPRFESLASQRMRGLTHATTFADAVRIDTIDTTGLIEDGSVSEKVDEGSRRTTATTRTIKNLDDQFHLFIEAIRGDVISLPTCPDVRDACSSAMASGQLVHASGSFFYEDFAWLTSTAQEFAKAQELLSKAGVMTKQQVDNFKKMLPMMDAVHIMFGKAVECGVLIDTEADTILVRAILDRAYLRDGCKHFVDRFGGESVAQYTMIGTVSRIGWEEGGAARLAEVRSEGGAADMGTAIRELQKQIGKIKRTVLGSEQSSVYIVPIAVYRSASVSPLTPGRA